MEEAASLADDLRQLATVRYWIVDCFSHEAMRYRRRNQMGKRMRNAPFRFEPDDWFAFFREHGWEVKEMRDLADVSEEVGREMPLPAFVKAAWRFWSLFMSEGRREALRRFAGYVVLQPR